MFLYGVSLFLLYKREIYMGRGMRAGHLMAASRLLRQWRNCNVF
jgi:hypothetical protein